MRVAAILGGAVATLVLGSSLAFADPCERLPPPVASYLQAAKGWYLVRLNVWTAEDQMLWSTDHPNACPGFTSVRFDGKNVSYGIAVYQKRNGALLHKLVSLKYDNGKFRVITLSYTKLTSQYMGVYKVPPRQTGQWDEDKPFVVRNDSIGYVRLRIVCRAILPKAEPL